MRFAYWRPTGGALAGQATTLTAQVSGSAGVPTGGVVFEDAGATLGTVALDGSGRATYSGNFSVGSHSLTASYAGDSAYLPSLGGLSYLVASTVATTTTLGATPNPSQPGQSVNVSASVTPASNVGALGGTVSVSGDGQNCSIVLPDSSCSLVFASKGPKKITASYSGNSFYSASTGSTTHYVGKRPSITPILMLLLD